MTRESTYRCSYCGKEANEYGELDVCDCSVEYILEYRNDGYTYVEQNNIDNILEDKRKRSKKVNW